MIIFTACACAQEPVSPGVAKLANAWFDHLPTRPRLQCKLKIVRPFLDFSFRFESGYIVTCPMRQFGGKKATLDTFVRVSRARAPPRLLGVSHDVPGVPAGMTRTNVKHSSARFSGGVSLGEGRYTVRLLVRDDRGRFFTKTWKINAFRGQRERGAPLELLPGEVTPVGAGPWERLRPSTPGLKLTILLDAAPAGGYSQQLHPWDRVLLLQTLSSLLEQTPCRSVRVIAFNLGQERQIFDQDRFNDSGFVRLSRTLSGLSLGTISYHAIEQGAGGHFIASLVNRETGGANPPDAVVILGPKLLPLRRLARQPEPATKSEGARLFYFQYFPNSRSVPDSSDPIASLIKARGGTVFTIDSPTELARAIRAFNELMTHRGAQRQLCGAPLHRPSSPVAAFAIIWLGTYDRIDLARGGAKSA